MMIPAFVVGVLIGGIIGWAIAAWNHARDDVSPAPNIGISAVGLGNGKGGHYIDSHFARMLKPVLEKMGWEVKQ
jgi:hypothetical protein